MECQGGMKGSRLSLLPEVGLHVLIFPETNLRYADSVDFLLSFLHICVRIKRLLISNVIPRDLHDPLVTTVM